MNMDKITVFWEAKVMPLANKMSGQRHLRAIRDAFVSILPITLVGGIASVLSAAPVTDTTTNGFLLAWAAFAEKNSLLLSWVNAVTMGSMALYICIGIVHFCANIIRWILLCPVCWRWAALSCWLWIRLS